jgi:hypothetical protein
MLVIIVYKSSFYDPSLQPQDPSEQNRHIIRLHDANWKLDAQRIITRGFIHTSYFTVFYVMLCYVMLCWGVLYVMSCYVRLQYINMFYSKSSPLWYIVAPFDHWKISHADAGEISLLRV